MGSEGGGMHPRDPGEKSFLRLAEAYRQEGLLDDAIRICRDGLARWPGSLRGRLLLGRSLIETGALGEALIELGRVEREAQGNAEILDLLRGVRWPGEPRPPRDAERPSEEPRVLTLDPPDAADRSPGATQAAAVPLLSSPTLATLYSRQGDAEKAAAIRRRMAAVRQPDPAETYLARLRRFRESVKSRRVSRADGSFSPAPGEVEHKS